MTSILELCNSANYDNKAKWPFSASPSNFTTVGTNGKSSVYGTYDQDGNVYEYTSSYDSDLDFIIVRGGSYRTSDIGKIQGRTLFINNYDKDLGFRTVSTDPELNMVEIGDVNNNNDATGYGNVPYVYYISKYAITNNEYVEFLNSVDKEPNNYELWNNAMSNSIIRSINTNTNIRTYTVATNMGNKPVTNISIISAARYCNWLHNDKTEGNPNDNTTEKGAYNLDINTSILPTKNNDAKYYIPSENEWYKAAYYQGGGTNSDYWTYATQNNDPPFPVKALSNGDGWEDYTTQNCISPTPTPSVTASATPTVTPTISVTPSVTASMTPSVSLSASPTPSVTPSITPTISNTPSLTPTRTPTRTPTPTASVTATPTKTPTPTRTITPTPTITPTSTVTPSKSVCPNALLGTLQYKGSVYSNDPIEALYKDHIFHGKILPNVSVLSSPIKITPSPTPTSSTTPTPTPTPSSTPLPMLDMFAIDDVTNQILTSNSDASSSWTYKTNFTAPFENNKDLIRHKSLLDDNFLLLCRHGSNINDSIFKSSDDNNWNNNFNISSTTNLSYQFNKIVYKKNNGLILVLQSNSIRYIYSRDLGESWINAFVGVSGIYNLGAYGSLKSGRGRPINWQYPADLYIVINTAHNMSQYGLDEYTLETPNHFPWTQRTLPIINEGQWTDLQFMNDDFILLNSNSDNIYMFTITNTENSSVDIETNWVGFSLSNLNSIGFKSIAFGNSKYVILNAENVIFYSDSLNSFVESNSYSFGTTINKVSFVNNVFLAYGINNTIYVSNDGTNWTQAITPNNTNNLIKVA